MRYSPKLQTEGDPSVPPGTKEMKEFKFIQAKICTESCVSESPPFQPQPQLVPAFFFYFYFFFASEDPCNFGCPICQSSRTAVWIVIDSQVFFTDSLQHEA